MSIIATKINSNLQDRIERQLTEHNHQKQQPSSGPSSSSIRRLKLLDDSINNTSLSRSISQQSHVPNTSANTSIGAPSPSFASSASSVATAGTGTDLRFLHSNYNLPNQGCCADCAVWNSHGTNTNFQI